MIGGDFQRAIDELGKALTAAAATDSVTARAKPGPTVEPVSTWGHGSSCSCTYCVATYGPAAGFR